MGEVKSWFLNALNVGWLTIALQDLVNFGLEAIGVCTLIWMNVERAVEARNKRKENETN